MESARNRDMRQKEPTLAWEKWTDLDRDSLYQLLQLRQRVLVVEQRSPYDDLDGHDEQAEHLLAWDSTAIVGCLRTHAPQETTASFGRLVVAPSHRRQGLARRMVKEALEYIYENYRGKSIEIEAQKYLTPFYSEFGFRTVGTPFDDCGVEHVKMVRTPADSAPRSQDVDLSRSKTQDMALTLTVFDGSYAICQLDPNQPMPSWATSGEWWSVTKTRDELSIVCAGDQVPTNVRNEFGWSLLKVKGPIAFALTGLLARLSTCLANGGVSAFALSTFDTDYLLVKTTDLRRAKKLLVEAGCSFVA